MILRTPWCSTALDTFLQAESGCHLSMHLGLNAVGPFKMTHESSTFRSFLIRTIFLLSRSVRFVGLYRKLAVRSRLSLQSLASSKQRLVWSTAFTRCRARKMLDVLARENKSNVQIKKKKKKKKKK